MISYDGMNLSNKADDKVGFIRLCLWDWWVIPLVLLNWAGSMLLWICVFAQSFAESLQLVLIGNDYNLYGTLYSTDVL